MLDPQDGTNDYNYDYKSPYRKVDSAHPSLKFRTETPKRRVVVKHEVKFEMPPVKTMGELKEFLNALGAPDDAAVVYATRINYNSDVQPTVIAPIIKITWEQNA